jgi:hypothetical protein
VEIASHASVASHASHASHASVASVASVASHAPTDAFKNIKNDIETPLFTKIDLKIMV